MDFPNSLNADITLWYAIIFASVLCTPIIIASVLTLWRLPFRRLIPARLCRFQYRFGRLVRSFSVVPGPHVAGVLLAVLSNVVLATISVHSAAAFSRRIAHMSIINLAYLALGARMNLVADSAMLSLPLFARIHRVIGVLALVEGLGHAVIALAQKHPITVRLDVAALIAMAGMGLLLLSSAGPFRRRLYETFARAHVVLSLTIAISAYVHVSRRDRPSLPQLYLQIAGGTYIAANLVRLVYAGYRNLRRGGPRSRATVRKIVFHRQDGSDIQLKDAIQLHIEVARPWQPRAGQYVYVTIPGMAFMSFTESHPFYVYQWRRSKNKAEIVVIIQKRRGLTRELYRSSAGARRSYGAVVEGPFGRELDLSGYGTVLIFATGIGIVGQMACVAQLLESYLKHDVKARQIKVFWEMESELHTAWVSDGMKELLERDADKILKIQLYVDAEVLSGNPSRGTVKDLGQRITQTFAGMDSGRLVADELYDRKGRTVVTMCVDDETNRRVRDAISHMAPCDVDVKQLDFEPRRHRNDFRWTWANLARSGSRRSRE